MVSDKLQFYLDENIPVQVARQLRTHNIDVVTVRDLQLLGGADEMHLANAHRLDRVLCTHDSDFLEIALDGFEHSGIVRHS